MASLFTFPGSDDHFRQTQTESASLRCPKCRRHRSLQHVHQAGLMQFLALFLPLKAYQCDRCAHKLVRFEPDRVDQQTPQY